MDAKTPNQVIALNLQRIRGLRGWTQEQAAEQIEPFLGQRWSKAVFSAAERSWDHPGRIRQFTGDELVAFAAAFEVPVGVFFEPPTEPNYEPRKFNAFAPPGASRSMGPEDLWHLAYGDRNAAFDAMFQVRSREETERAQARVAEQFGNERKEQDQ